MYNTYFYIVKFVKYVILVNNEYFDIILQVLILNLSLHLSISIYSFYLTMLEIYHKQILDFIIMEIVLNQELLNMGYELIISVDCHHGLFSDTGLFWRADCLAILSILASFQEEELVVFLFILFKYFIILANIFTFNGYLNNIFWLFFLYLFTLLLNLKNVVILQNQYFPYISYYFHFRIAL